MPQTITPEELIRKYTQGKLSPRPEYYSGRGNNEGDLNSEHLEILYGDVKAEAGPKAARAFVNMVAEMTADASATTFLIAFGHFVRGGFELRPGLVPKSAIDSTVETLADLHRSGKADAARSVAPFAIFGLLGGGARAQEGDGFQITGQFLMRHRDELDNPLAPRNPISGYRNNYRNS
jgi:hypothetical protein